MNKKTLIRLLSVMAALTIVGGCSWQVGGGTKHSAIAPTVGQQLVDLKRAKDAGTLTDAEYEAQKSKVLNGR